MIDPIVQEVRDARATIAAEFGYDLSAYLIWIREQTQLRKEANGNTSQFKSPETTDGTTKSSVTRKRSGRPTRVPA